MKRKSSKRVLGTRVTVRLPKSLYLALCEKAKARHESISTTIRTRIQEELAISREVKKRCLDEETWEEVRILLRALVQKSEQGVLPKAKRRAKERENVLNNQRKGEK